MPSLENCRFKLLLAAIIIAVSFVFVFVAMFVAIPILISRSVDLQRSLVFPTGYQIPPSPNFNSFEMYKIQGARNFQVLVNNEDKVSLGVWHLLPHAVIDDYILNEKFDFSQSLAQKKYPIVLYFHSNRVNRAKGVYMYNILRIFFHVIAFDYRGYGDSTNSNPSEEGIVQDSMALYKWLRNQTQADIYFWGHELGGALSAHAISKLSDQDIVPMGLFMEAPFTSIRDQLQCTSFYKDVQFLAWLPWFESTLLKPLERNGFVFDTKRYMKGVDCPVAIIHAEDDPVTPYQFSEELYESAVRERGYHQGNVTFILVSKQHQCGHFDLRKAPEFLYYIRDHIMICQLYNKGRG